MEPNNT